MMREEKERAVTRQLDAVFKNQRLATQTNFWKYAYRLTVENSIFGYFKKITDWLRRFRLVAFLIKGIGILLAVLQTGTALLLSTLLLLVALPLLTALLLGILLTALLESGKSNRRLLEVTKEHRVYVLFPTDDCNDFLRANALSLAKKENTTVIIVSPYWIHARGIRDGPFYFTRRREAENVYLIRRYYFFSLRRHVLDQRETAYLF